MAEFYSGNRYLNLNEMDTNAHYIYNYLGGRGWTLNAVAAMLANMRVESTINPAIWESLDSSDPSKGFGLVQWTPSTKYTSWCSERGLDPSHMDSALKRIEYELENGLQWIETDAYPLSFEGFKTATLLGAEYLAYAFMYNYERPASLDQPLRQTYATYYYELLEGVTPTDPSPDTPSGGGSVNNKSMSLLLKWAATRRIF